MRPSRRAAAAAAWVAAWLAAAVACRGTEREAARLTGGDPRRGRTTAQYQGCGSCHEIPGIPGANGRVGPPLDGIARRSYLAGRLVNTPANMVRWIQHPQDVVPGNAMPDMGLSDGDARDIAAFLYTLR